MVDEISKLAEEEALTAEEVAALLQVSRNTVYNLVKRDELASYHVGRKMRFSRADVQNYIARSRRQKAKGMPASFASASSEEGSALGRVAPLEAGPAQDASALGGPATGVHARAHAEAAGGFVIAGNDILGDMIANYLGAVEVPIKRVYEGSYRALAELYFGRAQAALAHIFDGATGTYNVAAVERLVPGMPLKVVRLARRRQGLIVARGNPKGLRMWEDLLRPGIRLANRERGCGSRILLDEKLLEMGVRGDAIEGYRRECPSALTVGSLVARGAADVGIVSERVFHQVENIDFLPLQDEWLDIVLASTPEADRVSEAIARLTRSRAFRDETAAISGYDTSHMGEVVFER